ncbi:pyridoxal-phosphate dependent enzyme [Salinicoccus carnicancri]|uniref:pyridoxal-phosphate dependent enzyme n=1 Tax=Salinicoccus carnicancri TaxID=558170 RepID=UPI00030E3010|nr:pyridoxal-phosphate dependent enzyme [Salinicoccus carnicancri]
MRTRYICASCGTVHEIKLSRWKCGCGGMLDLDFDRGNIDPAAWPEYPASIFRYAETMPLEHGEWSPVTLGEGQTPLIVLDDTPGVTYVKVDYMMPTLSFKDRGAAVLMAKANALGACKVIADSSGNAGTAIAAYAARCNIACDIYLSDATSPKKVAQMKAHGAGIRQINGTREDIAAAAQQAVAGEGVFYASHVYNPYFYEGTKTYAFEIFEELRGAPDTLIVPVGNGTLLLGAYYGFKELMDSGVIERLPKIVAVQAANCAPLAQAFECGESVAAPVQNSGTLAEGIAIAAPARAPQILEAVRETGGEFISVEESEIAGARREMSEKGFYVEVTSAANYAGYLKYGKTEDETLVIPLCGAGIKSE